MNARCLVHRRYRIINVATPSHLDCRARLILLDALQTVSLDARCCFRVSHGDGAPLQLIALSDTGPLFNVYLEERMDPTDQALTLQHHSQSRMVRIVVKRSFNQIFSENTCPTTTPTERTQSPEPASPPCVI